MTGMGTGKVGMLKIWGLGTSIFSLEAQRIGNVKLILSIDHDKEISYPILSGPSRRESRFFNDVN